MATWYYTVMGDEVGPVSAMALREEAMAGRIQPDTLVRAESMKQSRPAIEIKGLFEVNEVLPTRLCDVPFDSDDFEETLESTRQGVAHRRNIASSQSLTNGGVAESKTCPFCAETILAAAQKCKHCGEFFDRTARPPSDAPAWNPGVAAVLNLVIPGSGYLYIGRWMRAIVVLFAIPTLYLIALALAEWYARYIGTSGLEGWSARRVLMCWILPVGAHLGVVIHPYFLANAKTRRL